MGLLNKIFGRLKRTSQYKFIAVSGPIGGQKLITESIRMAHRNWQRNVSLPCIGRFVEESHYANNIESFPGMRLFPKDITEGINEHLERSLLILKELGIAPDHHTVREVYDVAWRRQWTPAEHGLCGQGARGNKKPDVLAELFQANMMFATGKDLPPMGTKFLVSANGRHCVVSMGYEIGPPEEKFLGGLTPEVHYYLRTDSESKIAIGRLANQSLPYGPLVQ